MRYAAEHQISHESREAAGLEVSNTPTVGNIASSFGSPFNIRLRGGETYHLSKCLVGGQIRSLRTIRKKHLAQKLAITMLNVYTRETEQSTGGIFGSKKVIRGVRELHNEEFKLNYFHSGEVIIE